MVGTELPVAIPFGKAAKDEKENWPEMEKGERGTTAPGHNMDERIRSLYAEMVREERHTEKISKKTQEDIYKLLGEWERGGNQNGGEVADKVLLAACAAEENGFVMGMRYAFRLFAECMQE